MRAKRVIVFTTVWIVVDIILSVFFSSLSGEISFRSVSLYFVPMLIINPLSVVLYNLKWWLTYLIIVRRQMVDCWLLDFKKHEFPHPINESDLMTYLQRIAGDAQLPLSIQMQAVAMIGAMVNFMNSEGYSKGRMLLLSAEEAFKKYKSERILNDA